MTQPRYYITLPGFLFAVSDNVTSDVRLFMFYLINNFHQQAITLSDMKLFFGDDTKTAIQTVYYLINMGWIDINDSDQVEEVQSELIDLTSLSDHMQEVQLVLSDSAGLTVLTQGLSRQDADCIAAQSRACLDTIMRSRRWSEQDNHRPSGFTIDWKDITFTGQIWHVGSIAFSLITPNDMPLQENHLCHMISSLSRRYYA